MFRNANPLFLICETQLHAGSGDDLGIVDLPIQRERHTSFPKIESSSFKGAVRESFEGKLIINETDDTKAKENLIKINKVFGFDDGELAVKQRFSAKDHLKTTFGDDSQFAGCIAFSDARLLLFPVKSMKGVFAWVTCEKVLKKLKADLELCENKDRFQDLFTEIDKIKDSDLSNDKVNYCYASSAKVKVGDKCVILEEYAFESKILDISKIATAFQGIFNADFSITDRLVVLTNDDFKDFVNLSTEVITRTKINNETGTVQDGALFTEEYLPSESILYTLVLTAPEFKKNGGGLTEPQVKEFFADAIKDESVIQIGGNATLGKGIIRTKFLTQEGGTK